MAFWGPELAGKSATAETGDEGQFLGGDPRWVQYDVDIIANLGQWVEVVWAGSEEAILVLVAGLGDRLPLTAQTRTGGRRQAGDHRVMRCPREGRQLQFRVSVGFSGSLRW